MAILYVLSALIAAWGIASYFCMGEKFMKWYYGQWGRDYREFDARKFKIAYAVSAFLVGVAGLCVVRLGPKWVFQHCCLLQLSRTFSSSYNGVKRRIPRLND